jgi:RNA 2',3'-cyclic 3'-phosphodiesterase
MTTEHRCFLAIDIEPNLIEYIAKTQNEFKKTNNNVKYVEKENLHFTLKFFGDITQSNINAVIDSVKKVLKNSTDKKNNIPEMHIEGIGTFPNENYMKVLWIGTKQNEFLNKLHHELDKEFERIGFKLDKEFKTHLTIGRIKNLKDKQGFKLKIDELKDVKIGKMNINKISLKKSQLTPKGPIYSDIEVFHI